MTVPGQRPSTDFFMYRHLALGWVSFIIIISLLKKFKICEGIQIRQIMLLHSKLLLAFITLSMKHTSIL